MAGINYSELTPKERLIVALDLDSLAKATPIVEALAPHVGYFKVGLELISAVGATQAIQHVHRHGGHVFLDGKFCDIPNTVGAASRIAASSGAAMFNVHASSGMDAMRAAVENKGSALAFAVTVLTSLEDSDSQTIFGASANDKVIEFAKMAVEAKMDGVVCSGLELETIHTHELLRKLLKIVPGVRPSWASADDQKRTLTPAEAIRFGATYIVMGRPILNPPRGIGSPLDAIAKVIEEIASVSGTGAPAGASG